MKHCIVLDLSLLNGIFFQNQPFSRAYSIIALSQKAQNLDPPRPRYKQIQSKSTTWRSKWKNKEKQGKNILLDATHFD